MSLKKIIRPISAILILAFLCQDIAWANPEILQHSTANSTLQIPTIFQSINTKTSEATLEAMCLTLMRYFPSIKEFDSEFNYRITPNLSGSQFELDFNQKRKEDNLIIIPCSVTTNRGCRLYEAVIDPKNSDDPVKIFRDGEREKKMKGVLKPSPVVKTVTDPGLSPNEPSQKSLIEKWRDRRKERTHTKLISVAGYLTQAVATMLYEARGDKDNIRGIAFDLARLLTGDHGDIFKSSIMGSMFNLQDFSKYYTSILQVYGEALVIASHFDPEIKDSFFEPAFYDPKEYFNDSQRSKNRLAGFYRDQSFALAFVDAFNKELKIDKPWYIDSQMAILDAIDGIEFKEHRVLDRVISRLNELLGKSARSDLIDLREENIPLNPLVIDRIGNLLQSLSRRGVEEGKTYREYLFERFEKIRSVKPEKTRLFKEMRRIEKRRFNRVDIGLGKDVIDEVEGPIPVSTAYQDRMKQALSKTRINYRSFDSEHKQSRDNSAGNPGSAHGTPKNLVMDARKAKFLQNESFGPDRALVEATDTSKWIGKFGYHGYMESNSGSNNDEGFLSPYWERLWKAREKIDANGKSWKEESGLIDAALHAANLEASFMKVMHCWRIIRQRELRPIEPDINLDRIKTPLAKVLKEMECALDGGIGEYSDNPDRLIALVAISRIETLLIKESAYREEYSDFLSELGALEYGFSKSADFITPVGNLRYATYQETREQIIDKELRQPFLELHKRAQSKRNRYSKFLRRIGLSDLLKTIETALDGLTFQMEFDWRNSASYLLAVRIKVEEVRDELKKFKESVKNSLESKKKLEGSSKNSFENKRKHSQPEQVMSAYHAPILTMITEMAKTVDGLTQYEKPYQMEGFSKPNAETLHTLKTKLYTWIAIFETIGSQHKWFQDTYCEEKYSALSQLREALEFVEATERVVVSVEARPANDTSISANSATPTIAAIASAEIRFLDALMQAHPEYTNDAALRDILTNFMRNIIGSSRESEGFNHQKDETMQLLIEHLQKNYSGINAQVAAETFINELTTPHAMEIGQKNPEPFHAPFASDLDDVIIRVMTRDRNFIARMLCSNKTMAREIANEIIESKPNEQKKLIGELLSRAKAASLVLTEEQTDLDKMALLAFRYVKHFLHRRGFGAQIAGATLLPKLEGIERALSVFIPAPGGIIKFTNPLAIVYDKLGDVPRALAAEAWGGGGFEATTNHEILRSALNSFFNMWAESVEAANQYRVESIESIVAERGNNLGLGTTPTYFRKMQAEFTDGFHRSISNLPSFLPGDYAPQLESQTNAPTTTSNDNVSVPEAKNKIASSSATRLAAKPRASGGETPRNDADEDGTGAISPNENRKEIVSVPIFLQAQTTLRDLRDPKLAVQNMIETILSILISENQNKLVLAFHSKLKGYEAKKVQVLIRQLNKLKGEEGFDKILRNLTIIQSFDSETTLRAEFDKNSVDLNDKNTVAFSFAPTAEQANLPNSNPNMHQVFIDEGTGFNASTFYYPLFEIVVMTLVKYHNGYDLDQMRAAFPLEEVNIADLIDDGNAFLIFALLPKIERYNTDKDRAERYVLLNKWINSAA